MSFDKDSILLLSIAIFVAIFLIASLPVKNWLEIKRVKNKELRWLRWLNEKPTQDQYCKARNQNPEDIKCDYCGAHRQLPSLEMVITYNPKFGIFKNTFDQYSHFKTYICSGCGTELYRERYEK